MLYRFVVGVFVDAFVTAYVIGPGVVGVFDGAFVTAYVIGPRVAVCGLEGCVAIVALHVWAVPLYVYACHFVGVFVGAFVAAYVTVVHEVVERVAAEWGVLVQLSSYAVTVFV